MKVVALVPARGGSKGIPRKNLIPVLGKPLLAYTADAALKSKKIAEVFLSTDDLEIARVGAELGLSVPFIRPEELAGDNIKMIDVISHFCVFCEKKEISFDVLVLLQATSPLRRTQDIDACLDLYRSAGTDSVVSVEKVPHNFIPSSIYKMSKSSYLKKITDGTENYLRQEKPVYFARNGPAIVVTTPKLIQEGHLYGSQLKGFEMSALRSIDIDTEEDLLILESILSRNLFKQGR